MIDENNLNSSFYILAHETCHLLFSKYIYKNNYSKRIVWLDESFATNFSGQVEYEIESGKFNKKVSKYINLDFLPSIKEISFKNNNIINEKYNAYDFFRIIGRYMIENYSKENLLKIYKNENEVLKLEDNILKKSILYFGVNVI